MYTLIYPYIPLYTLIYSRIPFYTFIYSYIPMYTLIYPYIPSAGVRRYCVFLSCLNIPSAHAQLFWLFDTLFFPALDISVDFIGIKVAATRRGDKSPQQIALCDMVNFMKIIVAAAEFCRCDQSHEFKPV